MSRAASSREQIVSRLLRASDPGAARAQARTARGLLDDETARVVMQKFTESVRQGRAPVAAAAQAASAAAAVAAVRRSPYCRAVAHRTAGIQAHLAGRPIVARRLLLQSAEILEEAGELLDAGDVHRTLIDVQMLAGDYAAARRAARQARACYDRAGNAGGRRLGGLALNVGNLHHRRDELREALASYSVARRHLQRAGERRLVATVDYNRGNILATMDRVDQARERYRKARAVFDSEKLPTLVAQADSALATLDLLEGRLDECIERLESVKQRQVVLGDREGVAHSELDQAEAFLRLNRPEEAKRAARSAEKYFSGGGFDAESALGACLLAGAELQAGRPSKAVRLFRRGRDLERRRRNPIGVAMLEIGLAQAEIRAGRAARGLDTARRSAAVSGRNRLRSRQARALAVGAEAALRSGRTALARRWAARALTIARHRRDYRVQLTALLALARIEEAAGRQAQSYRRLLSAERCMEKLRRGITTDESRLAFAVDKSEVYEALILNRLERGDRLAVRQALVFAERGKARALAERLAEGPVEMLGAGSPVARRLMDRLKRLERELALAESRIEDSGSRPGVRGSAVSRVASLTDSRMRTLVRLSREDPQRAMLAGAAPPDPWRGVQSLGANELVLEYTEAGGHFHLFCVDRDGVEAHPRVASVERVRDVADLLRFHLGKSVLGGGHSERFGMFIESALRDYLTQLYKMLLAPVADRLGGKTVRIIPHGILHGLPFHAMECDGLAVGDRCLVSYAPSLAVLGLLSRRNSRSKIPPLVLGVPDRSAPLIDDEVSAIRRHLPRTRVFRGPAATSEAVRLSENRPPLLHVACHGFYAEHSRLTGALRLGDAWLTLPEIYTLRGTAELVVLSGCETGRGTVYSGDEWVGLVRGFLQAGARSVVASLWEVSDRSAVDLMADFYRRLAAGSTVVEALTMAQRRARREDPTPLRWAPFMLIGDPTLKIAFGRGGVTAEKRLLTRIASAVVPVVLLLVSQAWAEDCGDDELVTRQIAMELARGASPGDLIDPPPFTVLDRIPEYRLWLLEVPEGTDAEQVAEELEDEQALVNRAEPLRLLETPEGVQRSIPDLGISFDKNGYVGQVTLNQINAPQAAQRYSGAGVTVAVLDTGIALQHPELAGAIVAPGADFAGGDGTPAAQPNGVDDDGDGDVDESMHHGTFVAGLICLVAPGARILPVRVLEADGKGTAFGVAKGILYAMRRGADVINLSLTMGLESRAVEIAIEDARDHGVVIVAAAGNRGFACVDFPADESETIAVASVDGEFVRTFFSNYGTQVDLSAPALDLLSTFGDEEFARWSGTSFATPLVSGGVALLLERYPGLTVDEVRDVLQTTAQPDDNAGLAGLMGAGALDLDAMSQVLASDRTSLKLHAGPEGTTLEWSPVLNATGYDVVRGEMAALDTDEGIVVLPSLSCMAEDAAATDTAGAPDAALPAPGAAFFYLFRDDALDGGAYDFGGADHRRVVGDLDCLLGGGG